MPKRLLLNGVLFIFRLRGSPPEYVHTRFQPSICRLPVFFGSLQCTGLHLIPVPPNKTDVSDPNLQPTSNSPNFGGRINSTYLIASFIDLGNHATSPTSHLHSFRIQKESSDSFTAPKFVGGMPPIEAVYMSSRTFESCVPIHLSSFIPFDSDFISSTSRVHPLLVYTNLQQSYEEAITNIGPRSKQLEVGKIQIISPESLLNVDAYEPSTLTLPEEEVRKSPLPLSIAISPNNMLVAISPATSDLLTSKSYLVPFPKRRSYRMSGDLMAVMKDVKPKTKLENVVGPLSLSLLDAHRSPFDIMHLYTQIDRPTITNVAEVISDTLLHLQNCGYPISDYQLELLCMTSSLSKANMGGHKSHLHDSLDTDREPPILLARDIASTVGLIEAYKIAQQGRGNGYDQEMVIPLIGLSKWFIKYVESIMYQLSLYFTSAERALYDAVENKEALVDASELTLTESNQLRLSSVHAPATLLPLILPNLRMQLMAALRYILSLKNHLQSQPSSDEKSLLANQFVRDILEGGGITWRTLYTELEALKSEEACKVPEEKAFHALYSLNIHSSLSPTVFNIAKRLVRPSVVSMFRLFGVGQSGSSEIDLRDFSELHKSKFQEDSICPFEKRRVDTNLDIISKTILDRNSPEVAVALRVCTRCQGLVERKQLDGPGLGASHRWRAWLRRWENRCVCGGFWALQTGF